MPEYIVRGTITLTDVEFYVTANTPEEAEKKVNSGRATLRRYGGGHLKWSAEKHEQMLAMFNAGVRPMSCIARELGITKNAVIGKLWRAGIDIRWEREAMADAIGAMIKELQTRKARLEDGAREAISVPLGSDNWLTTGEPELNE